MPKEKKTPEKNKNKNGLEVENTVYIPYIVHIYREIP
jgi:hypothetical protein